MNTVTSHIEYLLRGHEQVALPGIGIFMAEYRAAHFDAAGTDVILPPSRNLCFIDSTDAADTLLSRSVARKEGISTTQAAEIVKAGMEEIASRLETEGEAKIGNLGWLVRNEDGDISFEENDLSEINSRFYALQPVKLTPLAAKNLSEAIGAPAQTAPSPADTDDPQPTSSAIRRWNGSLRRNAVGIAASLAVVITLALFILNPIRIDNPPQTASIATLPETKPALPDIEAENPSAEYARFSIAIPADGKTVVEPSKKMAPGRQAASEPVAASPATISKRNTEGRYCVIVASFPTAEQAQRYIAEKPAMKLAILEKDGKYRIYAASADSYTEADALRGKMGAEDAWICRR